MVHPRSHRSRGAEPALVVASTIHDLNVRMPGLRTKVQPPKPDEQRDYALHQATQWIIFIHGFANSYRSAAKKYQRMMRALSELTGAEGTVDPQIAYLGFHWPGNHPVPGINQLTFVRRFRPATAAGRELAQWLHRQRSAAQVTLVAHSLGCRVALACVAELTQLGPPSAIDGRSRVSVPNVILMAGAVRRRDCAPNTAPFGPRYPQAHYTNLYSYYDGVLAVGFPAGSAFVGGLGRAIGWWGEPKKDRWDARVSTNLGHSGYWRSTAVGGSIATSMKIARTHLLPQIDQPSAEIAYSALPQNDLEAEATIGT
jgi:pimeloyl-ACP methyl ester carboxylesterase